MGPSHQPSTLTRRLADATLAALVVLLVGMMIVPLPTWLLDVLLTSNISIAVLMLLVSIYVRNGLSFTAFPTVLLVTTLYRLALNVSSTRLILLQADAGDVISSFGDFVVQGNYVVGAVVFLILTLIQFLVVAKGSERVAEVGARFTLDAMPGKQMSIDAELRAGAISQEEARAKRSLLQRETQFYGAMDGAMKFVKGDAIAGIVITFINLLAGLAIGVGMRDMDALDSLRLYGLLTIGDGLVSQIPALLISTAAGLVVTRVASEDADGSLGSDIAKQVFGDPRALTIAAIFLAVLAAIPGLPTLPFLLLATLFGLTAYRLFGRRPTGAAAEAVAVQQESSRQKQARAAMVPLVVPVAVDLGADLAELMVQDGAGPLLEEEVPRVRDRLFLDLGIALPAVRARRSDVLAPDEYVLTMQEVPVGGGIVPADCVFVHTSAGELEELGLEGEPSEDGVGLWVDRAAEASLEAAGLLTSSAVERVAAELGRAVARRPQELVGLQEVQTMLDQLERAYPALIRNVVPKPVPLALLADVLRRLVEEGISIRPLREILESLATYAPNERDPVALTELVRASLKRQITHRYSEHGVLSVLMLDPEIEEAIRDSVQRTATGSYLAMAPDIAREVVEAIRREVSAAGGALLLTQADVRRFARRLVEVDMPDLVVLSYQELAPEVTVQPLARVAL